MESVLLSGDLALPKKLSIYLHKVVSSNPVSGLKGEYGKIVSMMYISDRIDWCRIIMHSSSQLLHNHISTLRNFRSHDTA
jgi:hypothetical protein